MTVLVVEDDRDIRDALLELLADEGLEAVGAADVADALRAVRAGRPEVILLDLLMPGVGGRELLTYLELMPGLSDIPVVVMTASGVRIEGHRLLQKPFVVDEVMGAIHDAIASARGTGPMTGGVGPSR